MSMTIKRDAWEMELKDWTSWYETAGGSGAQLQGKLVAYPNNAMLGDAAAPVCMSAGFVDSDDDGVIDSLQLAFSENVVTPLSASVFARTWSVSPNLNIGNATISGNVVSLPLPATLPSLLEDLYKAPNVNYFAVPATATVTFFSTPAIRALGYALTDASGNPTKAFQKQATLTTTPGPIFLGVGGADDSDTLRVLFSDTVLKNGQPLTTADFALVGLSGVTITGNAVLERRVGYFQVSLTLSRKLKQADNDFGASKVDLVGTVGNSNGNVATTSVFITKFGSTAPPATSSASHAFVLAAVTVPLMIIVRLVIAGVA